MHAHKQINHMTRGASGYEEARHEPATDEEEEDSGTHGGTVPETHDNSLPVETSHASGNNYNANTSKGGSLPPGLAAFFRAGKGGFPSTTSYGFAEAFRIDRAASAF